MIRVSNLMLPLRHSESGLVLAAAEELGVPLKLIVRVSIVRKSLDTRAHATPRCVYTVDVALEEGVSLSPEVERKATVTRVEEKAYQFRASVPGLDLSRPVIVGAGPCGLFGALLLARHGFQPLLLERGRPVDERTRDVREFWRKGVLLPESNVLFGEGGAGAFSDGKLTTQIKDKENRRDWILREMVQAGAPPEILYLNRPHVGTDKLAGVVKNLRAAIIEHGGEVRFQCRVSGLQVKDGRLVGIIVNEEEEIPASQMLLAIGHSARDTCEMLLHSGVSLKQKAFSIGARIEHPQTVINAAQYGKSAGMPELGPAEYKLVHHCRNGRSVYSFCMCPGGRVIGVGHEPDAVVTNGMSYHARAGRNANSGLLVNVGPGDYGDAHPLAGIAFQRRWEQAAYALGGGGFKAPVQRVGDLLAGRASTALGDVESTYLPGVVSSDLRECLPGYVIDAWREAIPALARRLRGFDLPDAVLTGVETRSSSPVRIERDDTGESVSIKGMFPAGEGAGYAGGIISSAIDGMRAAEQIARSISGS